MPHEPQWKYDRAYGTWHLWGKWIRYTITREREGKRLYTLKREDGPIGRFRRLASAKLVGQLIEKG